MEGDAFAGKVRKTFPALSKAIADRGAEGKRARRAAAILSYSVIVCYISGSAFTMDGIRSPSCFCCTPHLSRLR